MMSSLCNWKRDTECSDDSSVAKEFSLALKSILRIIIPNNLIYQLLFRQCCLIGAESREMECCPLSTCGNSATTRDGRIGTLPVLAGRVKSSV